MSAPPRFIPKPFHPMRIAKVRAFLQEINAILKKNYPNFQVLWFGHIVDSNLHINGLKPTAIAVEDFLRQCKRFDKIMFGMIAMFQGSISAEHGVGLTKRAFHDHSHSAAEHIRSFVATFTENGLKTLAKKERFAVGSFDLPCQTF